MLDRLKAPEGSKTRKKRVGRGSGSGLGKTSGRGHKGQGSRSGGGTRPGFEGGQMPLARRLPKRGFTNIFRTSYAVVTTGRLNDVFRKGDTVDPESLRKKGLVKKKGDLVKVLVKGELKKSLTVRAVKFSKAAKAMIEAAGGSAEVA